MAGMYNSYLQIVGAPRARRHDSNVKQRTHGANTHDREGDRGGRTQRGTKGWSIDQTTELTFSARPVSFAPAPRRGLRSLVHVLHHVLLLLVHQQGEGVNLVHLFSWGRQLALLHALADGRDDESKSGPVSPRPLLALATPSPTATLDAALPCSSVRRSSSTLMSSSSTPTKETMPSLSTTSSSSE